MTPEKVESPQGQEGTDQFPIRVVIPLAEPFEEVPLKKHSEFEIFTPLTDLNLIKPEVGQPPIEEQGLAAEYHPIKVGEAVRGMTVWLSGLPREARNQVESSLTQAVKLAKLEVKEDLPFLARLAKEKAREAGKTLLEAVRSEEGGVIYPAEITKGIEESIAAATQTVKLVRAHPGAAATVVLVPSLIGLLETACSPRPTTPPPWFTPEPTTTPVPTMVATPSAERTATPTAAQMASLNLDTGRMEPLTPAANEARVRTESAFYTYLQTKEPFQSSYPNVPVIEFAVNFGDPNKPRFVFLFGDGKEPPAQPTLNPNKSYDLKIAGNLYYGVVDPQTNRLIIGPLSPPNTSFARMSYNPRLNQVEYYNQDGKLLAHVSLTGDNLGQIIPDVAPTPAVTPSPTATLAPPPTAPVEAIRPATLVPEETMKQILENGGTSINFGDAAKNETIRNDLIAIADDIIQITHNLASSDYTDPQQVKSLHPGISKEDLQKLTEVMKAINAKSVPLKIYLGRPVVANDPLAVFKPFSRNNIRVIETIGRTENGAGYTFYTPRDKSVTLGDMIFGRPVGERRAMLLGESMKFLLLRGGATNNTYVDRIGAIFSFFYMIDHPEEFQGAPDILNERKNAVIEYAWEYLNR